MKHNSSEEQPHDHESSHHDSRHFRFGHRCGSHYFRGRESEFGERFRRGGRHFGGWGGGVSAIAFSIAASCVM